MDSELSKIFAIHQIASLELGDLSGWPILCQITKILVLKVKKNQMTCVVSRFYKFKFKLLSGFNPF